jgi:hypothetical protein
MIMDIPALDATGRQRGMRFDGAYRYVLHGRVRAYEAIGWMFAADLGSIHGEWSCLMWWPCACKYTEPRPSGDA